MATTAVTAERDNYLNQEYGIKSWLLTMIISESRCLYLLPLFSFSLLGDSSRPLIRLELLTPAGDLVAGRHLQQAFLDARIIMVFFFLVPFYRLRCLEISLFR